jgi:hypothetical protein
MTVTDTRYQLLEEKSCLWWHKFAKKLNNHQAKYSLYKYTCNDYWRKITQGANRITSYSLTTSSSLNRPALHILAKSSPPAAYSMTIARCVGVNKTYKKK